VFRRRAVRVSSGTPAVLIEFFDSLLIYVKRDVFDDIVQHCILNLICCSTVHFDKYKIVFPTNALFIKT
jgi:hypothetical protein